MSTPNLIGIGNDTQLIERTIKFAKGIENDTQQTGRAPQISKVSKTIPSYQSEHPISLICVDQHTNQAVESPIGIENDTHVLLVSF